MKKYAVMTSKYNEKGLPIKEIRYFDTKGEQLEYTRKLPKTISRESFITEMTERKRLKIYDRESKPIIDYYKKTNRYNSVISINSIEDTFNDIVTLIEKIRK